MKVFLSLCSALLLSTSAFATPEIGDDVKEGYVCIKDHGLARVIRINRADAGKKVPCEVIYERPTEDGAKLRLWFANYDKEFCTNKADGLAMRLADLDWECESIVP